MSFQNLLKAGPDKLVEFLHFILSRLLFLIANPPYTDELSMKAFECIGSLAKLFSRILDSDVDSQNRSMLLASFVKYRKQAAQESKPHSNIRPVEMKNSPSDMNMLNSMIGETHIDRADGTDNSQLFQSTWRELTHQQMSVLPMSVSTKVCWSVGYVPEVYRGSIPLHTHGFSWRSSWATKGN